MTESRTTYHEALVLTRDLQAGDIAFVGNDWVELMDVFRSLDEVGATFGTYSPLKLPTVGFPIDAYSRLDTDEVHVAVRFVNSAKSRSGEVADKIVMLPAVFPTRVLVPDPS